MPAKAAEPSAAAPDAVAIRHWPWAAAAAAMASGVFAWGLANGRLLLYGDATAHLMIARRMVDSRTPGLSQWGSVWLPFPHLLMAPFTLVMAWWRTGAAGSVVAIASFALAAWFLHRLAARHFGGGVANWAALAFLLNPNLLYLASVPMTEAVYLMAFLGAVDQISLARMREPDAANRHVIAAGLWALAAAMTRYDGWFCLPFFAAALTWPLTPGRWQWGRGARFCAVAGIGPLFWFAYNQFYFGDWLNFLRGPYSARAIYLRALRHGGQRYPGDHHLAVAVQYFTKAVALDCGWGLLVLGALGVAVWLWPGTRAHGAEANTRGDGRRWRPGRWVPGLLLLPLPWYVWAMRSGNVPIFVPMYWPHGYYNLRYGVQPLAAAAVFSGVAVAATAAWRGWGLRGRQQTAGAGLSAGIALFARGAGPAREGPEFPTQEMAPAARQATRRDSIDKPAGLGRPGSPAEAARKRDARRSRAGARASQWTRLPRGIWILGGLIVLAGYLAMLGGEGPMTYAEAVHNAPARLAVEHKLAAALSPWRPGQTVLMYLGSYPGALPDDGIPLRAVIEESNFRQWDRALRAPQRYAAWVVYQAGSPLAAGINQQALRRHYRPVARFTAPRQPVITVYRSEER